jgi:hypothetical protein
MAVFFLQTGGYLLSVKTIRDYNPTESLVIDGNTSRAIDALD